MIAQGPAAAARCRESATRPRPRSGGRNTNSTMLRHRWRHRDLIRTVAMSLDLHAVRVADLRPVGGDSERDTRGECQLSLWQR